MNAEQISTIAGALLSFAFRLPGIQDRYDQLTASQKQWVMLGTLVLTAASMMALACSGWGADLGITVVCDRPGWLGMLSALVGAIMGNQGVYSLTKQIGKGA